MMMARIWGYRSLGLNRQEVGAVIHTRGNTGKVDVMMCDCTPPIF